MGKNMIGTAHTEWGLMGVETMRARVTVLVIVDILSFSTAVDIAVGCGAAILPFPSGDRSTAQEAATKAKAQLAAPRQAGGGHVSLSPRTLGRLAPGTRLMLPSPNGSRISLAGGGTSVMAGCLRNAPAVAAHARMLAGQGDIAVIPAGERWPDGSLRPAIEDWLGAGAILDALAMPMSSEAALAREAYRSALLSIGDIIRGSVSGRELIDEGYSDDVALALDLQCSAAAPVMRDGAYRNEAQ
jgi:2-phosphosulfolactate phosphatase